MKRILIPLTAKPNECLASTLHVIRDTYVQTLVAHQMLPVCIPVTAPIGFLLEELELCDGLLLMGGADFNPNIYGER